ncbi:MAG: cofactor-independent phosphoglycerate mutase [Spirochaetaceae bacterium]|nr:cofactor-independent phosphoglycerate mutase [Spirochaetaceae bacterium]
MKYVIVLGDGMADRPIKKLQGKTPLEVADKPHIDSIAKAGKSGKLKTIPEDMPKGSAVANLGVLGYDSHQFFQGRGVLEAANMGIHLDENDLALRLNLMTIEDEKIKNHSAGHIGTEEAAELVEALNKSFEYEGVQIFPGISYKHLLVIKGGSSKIECFPPHDYPGIDFKTLMVKPLEEEGNQTAELLNELITRSHEILKDHPVNIKRMEAGKDPANSIWPWSQGNKPLMPTFKELYNLNGAIISAVDLINGIGVYAGMDIIKVEGATGLYDTNYEGKAEAAIEALKTHDFLYLHVEATDEAGHDGDTDLKIQCIEYLDHRIVKYLLEHREEIGDELTIAVLPDHPTPVELRTHTREAVPFAIMKPGEEPDAVEVYTEKAAEKGAFGTIEGPEFIRLLIS